MLSDTTAAEVMAAALHWFYPCFEWHGHTITLTWLGSTDE